MPDLSKPARCSSLDIWRPGVRSDRAFTPENTAEAPLEPATALKITLFVIEHFDLGKLEQRRPYIFPDLLGKSDEDTCSVIRVESPDNFWADMEQSLQDQSYSINIDSLRDFSNGHKLARTKNSFALCPLGTKPNDVVCLIAGSCVPFVLRPTHSLVGNGYNLIGECYLHGLRGPKSLGEDPNYVHLLGVYADKLEVRSTEELPWKFAYLL